MLREPAELLHSLHRQWLKTGYENLVDFEKALAADGLRARGASMPRHSVFPWGLAYSGVCRFTDQVSRYFETFGRDNVRVILYDDFKRSPESEYRRTLHFLGIDDAVPPHLGIVNRGHDVRFHGLNRLVRRGARHAGPAGRWLPRPLRRAIKSAVDRVNLRPASGGLRPEVRRALQHQYSVEIENLAALLNRDLSSWLSDDSRPKMHNSGRTAVGVGNAGEEVFADLPEARSKQEG